MKIITTPINWALSILDHQAYQNTRSSKKDLKQSNSKLEFKTFPELKYVIQEGDVFFQNSYGIAGYLIRFFTGGTVSHCGIFLNIEGELYAVESTLKTGVHIIKAEHIKGKMIVARPHSIPTDFYKKVFNELGKPYNAIGVMFALWIRVKDKGMFCSEFVTYALKLKFEGLSRGIEPSDILNILTYK